MASSSYSRQDLFLTVAALREAPEKTVREILSVTDGGEFEQELSFLVNDKLIERQGDILRYAVNANSELLFDLLSFAVTYDINYNNYFSSTMLIFLEQAYAQNYFFLGEIQQHPEMRRRNVSILRKNGFLLILEHSPFRAKIIQNSFFDLLLKINHREVSRPDKKKKPINVEAYLVERLLKKQLIAKMGSSASAGPREIRYIETNDPESGVTLTLTPQQLKIKEILKEKNKEALNLTFMQNLRAAQEKMKRNVSQNIRLSKDVILDYHTILMNDPLIGGVFRTEPVQVAGNPHFKICPHQKIIPMLDKLIDRYEKQKFKGLPDIVKFGAFLHNELQHIHPFVDGNSRLTRLVMEHFFTQNNLPNYEIPAAYISRYTVLTKGARKRDDGKLFELLKEILLYMICLNE